MEGREGRDEERGSIQKVGGGGRGGRRRSGRTEVTAVVTRLALEHGALDEEAGRRRRNSEVKGVREVEEATNRDASEGGPAYAYLGVGGHRVVAREAGLLRARGRACSGCWAEGERRLEACVGQGVGR